MSVAPPYGRFGFPAVIVTVGASPVGGCEVTPTVTVAESFPPAPVQKILKKVVVVRFDTVCDPPFAFTIPDQVVAGLLLATHCVAFCAFQESIVAPPDVTDVGFAVKVTVGGFCGCTTVTVALSDADPPGPVHVSVYIDVWVGDTD
jgi:hypothetical protein